MLHQYQYLPFDLILFSIHQTNYVIVFVLFVLQIFDCISALFVLIDFLFDVGRASSVRVGGWGERRRIGLGFGRCLFCFGCFGICEVFCGLEFRLISSSILTWVVSFSFRCNQTYQDQSQPDRTKTQRVDSNKTPYSTNTS